MYRKAALFIAAGLCALMTGCASRPGMYVGRTTLMEKQSRIGSGQTHLSQKQQIANLINIAMSQRVLSNAAATLSDLGMKTTPEEVLAATEVTPVKDTNIIAIEVTLLDPKEAKVAADVMAAEFKKVYCDLQLSDFTQQRERLTSQTEQAEKNITRACAALQAYQRTHKSSADPKLVKLHAEVEAAKDTYLSLRKKLTEAVMEEQSAKTDVALATIDPAFVRRAE